jgi:hypothetical protein
MSERNRYQVLILTIFRNHHKKGVTEFEFPRTEIETVAKELDIVLPKNLGDLIYSFRYRRRTRSWKQNRLEKNGSLSPPDAHSIDSGWQRSAASFPTSNWP